MLQKGRDIKFMNLACDTFLVRFQTGPTSDMFRQKGAENSDTKLLPNVILVTILRQYCFSHYIVNNDDGDDGDDEDALIPVSFSFLESSRSCA